MTQETKRRRLDRLYAKPDLDLPDKQIDWPRGVRENDAQHAECVEGRDDRTRQAATQGNLSSHTWFNREEDSRPDLE